MDRILMEILKPLKEEALILQALSLQEECLLIYMKTGPM